MVAAKTTVVKMTAPEMTVAKDEKLTKKTMKMIKMLFFNSSTERRLKSEKGRVICIEKG